MQRLASEKAIANRVAADPFFSSSPIKQRVRNILIVGDFDVSSKLHLQALGRRGFSVFWVSSPANGIALFLERQLQIDLVVIDAAAPSSGNLDFAAELARLRPALPVLYVFGARKTVIRCSIEAHAPASALTAPFNEMQLMERLAGLLDTRNHTDRQLDSAA